MRLRPIHAIPALALLALTACAEAGADNTAAAPSGPAPTTEQNWTTCRDPNRGLVAANACTALIESGQVPQQSLLYAHYNRGLALSKRGRTQAAIEDFDFILKQDPQFSLALYQRGIAYTSLGQQARGEQDIRRARILNPRLP